MKKALMKDTIKEIKNTYRRFISILLMAFLGVGFFAGIRATSPDMLNTIDEYYKNCNVYDIEVLSTLGLTNEDIEALKNVEGVEDVYGAYEKDSIINMEDSESVAKIICLDDINSPRVVEGRLPEEADECVVEPLFLNSNNMKIGDKVLIEMEDTTNDDGEKIPYLKEKEVEIVGSVECPLYISRDKGTSKLGSGKVNYFIYVNEKNINAKDVYTQIYIKTKDSGKYVTSTDDYENYIAQVKTNVEQIKQEREQARHEMLVNKATTKLEDAKQTFNEEKSNGEKQIAEAENELEQAKVQYENGEAELEKNKNQADSKFASAEKQLNDAKAQLQAGENELQAKEAEANSNIAQAQSNKTKLQNELNSVNSGLEQVNQNYNNVVAALSNPNLPEEQKAQLQQTKATLEAQRTELTKNKQQIESGINKINQSIAIGQSELAEGKKSIENSKAQLAMQEQTLQTEKKNAYAKIEEAKQVLKNSKTKLDDGESQLETKKQEFNDKIRETEGELIDAQDKIAQIENATWYVLDRNTNQGYTSFIQDTKSIESLGVVFPIVFFVIATLISLTSMTRMVEEERTQIGTLKALGYTKMQIASKYLIYATAACVLGGALGMFVGCAFLPRVIWMMYSLMYQINYFVVHFNVLYSAIGLIAASICIVGATLYVSLKELVNTPAVLMRPKSPKNGKRVLLERIPFIWKRLNFTRKVTVRNLFRYKKRFLMTIIGISGCTALIIAGFGMKDSISALLPNQFEKVFKYDMQISLKGNLEESQKDNLMNDLLNRSEISQIVETNTTAGDLVKDNNEEEVQIIVPKEKSELEKVINLNDIVNKQKVELHDNDIVITEKVAELINAKKGDIVKLKLSDEETKEFKVANIVENYVSHYVYMSKNVYEKSYGNYATNVLYVIDEDIDKNQEDNLIKDIVEKNEISSVSPISTIIGIIDNMMSSLNYVVIILIVCAGILAFVVLYNLSNVNISERIRELATIKVLGFYDKEVFNYISRETVILTLIGIILGCIGGYFLNLFILGTCEISSLRFAKIVNPISYLYSILITIVFTVIVNIVTYFSLKKIDMIESLKSVE